MDLDSHDEHRERARAFAEREVLGSVGARDRESRWDGALFRRLGDAGLLGAVVPRALGGGDLCASDVSRMLIGFGEGAGDAGLALAWTAHSFGCAAPIQRFGTEAQRQRYLSPLARGEWVGAFAHREPEAAADPIGIRTRAEKRGGRWILRGSKTWVVNGSIGDVFVVTAVTDPLRRKEGISTFLVERDAPGLVRGRRTETLGMRTAVISEITFDDCEVPEDSLLGPEGSGLLDVCPLVRRWERACLLAPWIGFMRTLLDQSIREARERFQLGKPVGHFQSTRATLADMRIRIELCQRIQARAAWQLDRGDSAGDRDIAVACLLLTHSVAQVTQDALRIHGAHGLEVDRLTERLYRDAAVIGSLGEGIDVLRSVIAGSLLDLG
ncbi:MAG: acyl-CoA dehydrogenase family protein [Minicystis sp.]